jgi:hypothetical protein
MSCLLVATLLAEFSQPHQGLEMRINPAARRCESQILSSLRFLRSLVLLVWMCTTIDLKQSSRKTEIPF